MLKFQPPFNGDTYYQQKAKENAKENPKPVIPKVSAPGPSRTPLVDTIFNGELYIKDLSQKSHVLPKHEAREQPKIVAQEPIPGTHGNNKDGRGTIQEVFDCDLVGIFQSASTPVGDLALRNNSPGNDSGQKVKPGQEGRVVLDVTSECFESDTVPHIETTAFNKSSTLTQSSLGVSDEEGSDMISDEWEGEIIEEGLDGFMVDWKPSLVPKSFASMEMVQAWELKKNAFLAKNDKHGDRSGIKRGVGMRGRIMKTKGQPETKRKRGRPRKVQP